MKKENDDYNSIMIKTLADRLAEALAELMHQRVRKEWGFPISGWKTFGLDPNVYNIQRTSKYAKTRLGKLRKDSYEENSFDAVTCYSTFYYIRNPSSFLQNVKRILKPRGVCIIKQIPNFNAFYAKINYRNLLKSYPPGQVFHYFTPKSIKDLVYKSGLKILNCKTNGIGRYERNFVKINVASDSPKKAVSKIKVNKIKIVIPKWMKFNLYNQGSSISLILMKK